MQAAFALAVATVMQTVLMGIYLRVREPGQMSAVLGHCHPEIAAGETSPSPPSFRAECQHHDDEADHADRIFGSVIADQACHRFATVHACRVFAPVTCWAGSRSTSGLGS